MPKEADSNIREGVSSSNNTEELLGETRGKTERSLPISFYLGCQHLRLVSPYQRNNQDNLSAMPTSQSDTDSTSLGLLPCGSELCQIAN